MGVVDEEYIKKAKDPSAVIGRKIVIHPNEIVELVRLLKLVGRNLAGGQT
jgi:hypothetical protein